MITDLTTASQRQPNSDMDTSKSYGDKYQWDYSCIEQRQQIPPAPRAPPSVCDANQSPLFQAVQQQLMCTTLGTQSHLMQAAQITSGQAYSDVTPFELQPRPPPQKQQAQAMYSTSQASLQQAPLYSPGLQVGLTSPPLQPFQLQPPTQQAQGQSQSPRFAAPQTGIQPQRPPIQTSPSLAATATKSQVSPKLQTSPNSQKRKSKQSKIPAQAPTKSSTQPSPHIQPSQSSSGNTKIQTMQNPSAQAQLQQTMQQLQRQQQQLSPFHLQLQQQQLASQVSYIALKFNNLQIYQYLPQAAQLYDLSQLITPLQPANASPHNMNVQTSPNLSAKTSAITQIYASSPETPGHLVFTPNTPGATPNQTPTPGTGSSSSDSATSTPTFQHLAQQTSVCDQNFAPKELEPELQYEPDNTWGLEELLDANLPDAMTVEDFFVAEQPTPIYPGENSTARF